MTASAGGVVAATPGYPNFPMPGASTRPSTLLAAWLHWPGFPHRGAPAGDGQGSGQNRPP
jgi:hypothetical protein